MGSITIPVGPVSVDLLDDDRICQHIKRGNGFEPDTLAAWARMVKPGSEVLDIGAYSGLFSIAAAKLGARPVAIEPMPVMARRVRRNAELNGVKVNVIEAAADNRKGVAEIGYTDAYLTSGASLARKSGNRLMVKTIRIDDLRLSNVSAIKIDVERGELRVLAGATRTIARERPMLIIETLGERARAAVRDALAAAHTKRAFLDKRNLIMEPRR